MPTPWNTNLFGIPLTDRTPLYLYRSADFSLINCPIHRSSLLTFKSPSSLHDTLVVRSSCWCSASSASLRKSGSFSRIFSMLKPFKFNSLSMGTLLFWQRMMSQWLFTSLMRFSILTSSALSGTRSILFSRTRSANAICSLASFSTPSGFSSSRRMMMCLASTTVRTPSRLYSSGMISSTKKVWITGAGSARPVVSMRTASKLWTFL
mmetsp:Transcript_7647/g.14908  ORF Transcript_7647/g.14908 Transcript_7647/m.14908 type:complete len:207 (+) Transcript_7647:455-1075(+)